ncbi:ABC transporter substrate-binding protein [Glycomyces dulcitolivorans]|uniref:ABC transporter substrate-binding protein n=1 Tax=Glycomyces dulcitolivorans TaxID=2200759 RepID=UPI000DD47A25|nr:ABC transporter substrate-binding protein [Glycomyces dulcitolivorans]
MTHRPARPSRRILLQASAAVGAGGLLAACTGTGGDDGTATVLYTAGLQDGEPANFNPLGWTASWPVGNYAVHLYETLFNFNLLTGESEPLLASGIEWADNTGTVTLHEGTAWQDGKPLTSADVVATFRLGDRNEGIAYGDVWTYVDAIDAPDDRTVTFTLNAERPQRLRLMDLLCFTYILPAHIWDGVADADLTEFANTEPVGSGPYTLESYTHQDVTLALHKDYWGNEAHGKPVPAKVVHAIYEGNDAANLSFQNGDIDLSAFFLPRVNELWEDRGLPVKTWEPDAPYHLPGSIPMLIINTTTGPLADARVRRALAHAIDYAKIAESAMAGMSDPAQASVILPEGAESVHFNAEAAAAGWSYDPAEAARILEEEVGAAKGEDGIYVLPDGTRLGPFKAATPQGWTDWNAALDIVATTATEAGIDVVTEFSDFSEVNDNLGNGAFDMVLWYVSDVAPSSPWSRIRDLIDDREVPPVGEMAFWNFGRFHHDDVPALLDEAATAPDAAGATAAYTALDDIIRAEAPAIPLMYRPLEFYQFSEKHWTGFPTKADPYCAPMQGMTGIQILTKIKPVEQQ